MGYSMYYFIFIINSIITALFLFVVKASLYLTITFDSKIVTKTSGCCMNRVGSWWLCCEGPTLLCFRRWLSRNWPRRIWSCSKAVNDKWWAFQNTHFHTLPKHSSVLARAETTDPVHRGQFDLTPRSYSKRLLKHSIAGLALPRHAVLSLKLRWKFCSVDHLNGLNKLSDRNINLCALLSCSRIL